MGTFKAGVLVLASILISIVILGRLLPLVGVLFPSERKYLPGCFTGGLCGLNEIIFVRVV